MKLSEKISDFEFQPEVYTYPTTRCYKKLDGFSIVQPEFTDEINVYVHIPFCRQICTFCGYLKTLNSDEMRKGYLSALIKEIEMYKEVLGTKKIITVDIGGGTPSLLQPEELGEIIDALKAANGNVLSTAKDVSIEATPESVEYEKFKEFKDLGINRVSIGVESFVDKEISLSGRHNSGSVSANAIKMLKEIGFNNVVCDLMAGVEGQTMETFSNSVNTMLDLGPDTVEIYALGIIPGTMVEKRSAAKLMNNKQKYECYEIARRKFIDAGYHQACHNRYSRFENGGYLQEDTVFRGTSLVGFGAGARSYAQNMHYRNPFEGANGKTAIYRYMDKINSNNFAVESGVFLSSEERMRKYVIGNIESLDLHGFSSLYGIEFKAAFVELYNELISTGCAEEKSGRLKLTPKGLLFRDLIARQFFSEDVEAVESSYRTTV